MSRQIIVTRILQPLNTIRRIQVAIPSRAEFEPGFYRWLERLARMAGNLECRIAFHGRNETLQLVNEFIRNRFQVLGLNMKRWRIGRNCQRLVRRFERTTSLS